MNPPSEGSQGRKRPAGGATVPAPRPITRKRILLVDDDAGVRNSLAAVLSGEGYVVVPACNGEEALKLAATLALDLVVLDLNMPVKNGWETLQQLTRLHPLLPVVIITARANQFFTALGAGVGGLLEKPLEIPVLLQTVARLLTEPGKTRLDRLAGGEAPFTYSRLLKAKAARSENPTDTMRFSSKVLFTH